MGTAAALCLGLCMRKAVYQREDAGFTTKAISLPALRLWSLSCIRDSLQPHFQDTDSTSHPCWRLEHKKSDLWGDEVCLKLSMASQKGRGNLKLFLSMDLELRHVLKG